MPKKEKKQEPWKAVGCSILCALGVYLLMQFVNALLVAREVVGEGNAATLVWVSAGLSVLTGVLVMGRGCRTGRLLIGGGSALGFALVLLLASMAAGNSLAVTGRQLIGTAATALAGGVLAALMVRQKKGHRTRRKR